MVLTLPLYGIVLFGANAMINIGWHLFTLRDCDEAYHELVGQIKQAREELSKKGMKFENAKWLIHSLLRIINYADISLDIIIFHDCLHIIINNINQLNRINGFYHGRRP